MNRREFITFIGCVPPAMSLASPIVASAQPGERVRRIGVFLLTNDSQMQARVAALRQGLAARGWIEGRNYQFEFRWPGGDPERMRALAAELVTLAPDVLVVGAVPLVMALKQQTSSIPIVFLSIADPVGNRVVPSLKSSGSNITGFTAFEFKTAGKWLELLVEIRPDLKRAAFIYGGTDFGTTGEGFAAAIAMAAAERSIGLIPIRLTAGMRATHVEAAIAAAVAEGASGLIGAAEGGVHLNRASIIAQAAHHRLPAVYPFSYYAEEGGLAAYGVDILDQYRRAADYIDRLLKGAKPADLPVQAPDKFELIVNLKTATSQAIIIPPVLLARADKVIE
jgi:putative ABC transport system substrate-binding protein